MEKWHALSPQQRLVFGALAASLFITAASLADPKGLSRLQRLRAEAARQEQRNLELRESNARLSRTVKELSAPVDPVALERAAREQLGFTRPDELLFKFE
jgi:cell division protein FtsB